MRFLLSLLACCGIYAATLGISNPQFGFVDSAAGNDSTGNGSRNAPWATIAKADAVLPANYPLMVKMPDGTWLQAPPVWHGLVMWLPMIQGSDATKVYDVAASRQFVMNGGTMSYTAPLGLTAVNAKYLSLSNAGLAPGTGDLTLAITLMETSGTQTNLFFKGESSTTTGVYLKAPTNTSVSFIAHDGGSNSVTITSDNSSALQVTHSPYAHRVIGTMQRGSSTGMKLYIDGGVQSTVSSTTALSGSLGTSNTYIGGISTYFTGHTLQYSRALSSTEAASLDAWLASEVARRFDLLAYYADTFYANYTSSTVPHFLRSADRATWYEVGNTYSYASTGGFGNTSMLRLSPTAYLLSHETPALNNASSPNPLGVAYSIDGRTWSHVGDNYCANVWPGFAAQGHLFQDSDGSVHQICFHNLSSYTPSNTDWHVYESHPTTAGDYSAWSAGVELQSGIPHGFNPFLTKVGSTYYLYAKNYTNGNAGYYGLATNTALTATGWTTVYDGTADSFGWGAVESLSIIYEGGTTYRAIFYNANTSQEQTSVSTTGLTGTWSTPADCTGVSGTCTAVPAATGVGFNATHLIKVH